MAVRHGQSTERMVKSAWTLISRQVSRESQPASRQMVLQQLKEEADMVCCAHSYDQTLYDTLVLSLETNEERLGRLAIIDD